MTWASGRSSPISSRNSVPPAGRLEVAGVRADGSRERAARVPEQQRLDEALGQGAAVDLLERPPAAAALRVDRACEQLLARAGLALDQDGDVVRGDPAGARPGSFQQRTAADDGVELG